MFQEAILATLVKPYLIATRFSNGATSFVRARFAEKETPRGIQTETTVGMDFSLENSLLI